MRKVICTIIILLPLFFSCKDNKIIPKKTMSEIYCDIYLADKYADAVEQLRKKTDTLLVYEPIFNKYGYTSADYLRSTDYYLKQPDKFAKIFKKSQDNLKLRKDYLERLLEKERGLKHRWDLLDSLSLLSNSETVGNHYYRALHLIFYTPDSIILNSSPVIDSSLFEKHNNIFFEYDSLPDKDGQIIAPIKEFINNNQKDTTKRIKPEFEPEEDERVSPRGFTEDMKLQDKNLKKLKNEK